MEANEITDSKKYTAKTACVFCQSTEIVRGKVATDRVISPSFGNSTTVHFVSGSVPLCAKCKAVRKEEDILEESKILQNA